jgi:hypothetical protein
MASRVGCENAFNNSAASLGFNGFAMRNLSDSDIRLFEYIVI